jgi:hypothetical protein
MDSMAMGFEKAEENISQLKKDKKKKRESTWRL